MEDLESRFTHNCPNDGKVLIEQYSESAGGSGDLVVTEYRCTGCDYFYKESFFTSEISDIANIPRR